MYNGTYLVLERSLRFFKIQVGTRQDTVSTLRLKPCRSPPDAQPAVPPRRSRPLMDPATATMPADVPWLPAARRCRLDVPLPRHHRTSGVAAAAAASSVSFQTPRQTRRPSAEVSLNILTDAWNYGLTVVLSPIKV
jgi:hypothetical protein